MNKTQRRALVRETLLQIKLHSNEAENLIIGTIAQESRGGEYLRQLGGGPALGICQMEPETFEDIWKNYLEYKPHLKNDILKLCVTGEAEELVWNLKLAIAMCRVHYLRVSQPIPFGLTEQAYYWKKHYNTPKGKGTVDEYLENYKKYAQ